MAGEERERKEMSLEREKFVGILGMVAARRAWGGFRKKNGKFKDGKRDIFFVFFLLFLFN